MFWLHFFGGFPVKCFLSFQWDVFRLFSWKWWSLRESNSVLKQKTTRLNRALLKWSGKTLRVSCVYVWGLDANKKNNMHVSWAPQIHPDTTTLPDFLFIRVCLCVHACICVFNHCSWVIRSHRDRHECLGRKCLHTPFTSAWAASRIYVNTLIHTHQCTHTGSFFCVECLWHGWGNTVKSFQWVSFQWEQLRHGRG